MCDDDDRDRNQGHPDDERNVAETDRRIGKDRENEAAATEVKPATRCARGAKERARTNIPSGSTTEAKTTSNTRSTRPMSAPVSRTAAAAEACIASG